MKKVLALIIALGIVSAQVCTLPQNCVQTSTLTVCAEQSGSYTYELLSDGTAKITGFSGKNTELDIPSTLGGKSVSAIGKSAFASNTALKKVTIPASVKSLGESAFSGCTALSSVTLTGSLTALPESAFSHCTSLKSVAIPYGVKTVGKKAFAYCTALSKVSLASTVRTIGDSAFEDCTSLTAVTLPSGVNSIGSSAFWDCTSLSKITIPSSVARVGTYAFGNTKWLADQREKNPLVISGMILIDAKRYQKASVTLPGSVKIIADGAFAMNDNIKKVVLPHGVKTVGSYAFYNCGNLSSVTIPTSVTTVGDHAFYGCEQLTSIQIPASVTSLGSGALGGCKNLRSAVIGSSVTDLPDLLFENCTSLEHFAFPSKLKTVGVGSFAGCTSLTSAVLPSSVTAISNKSFLNCKKLESLYLPDGLASVGNSAFEGCTTLAKVTVPDSVTSIGSKAFGYYQSGSKKLSAFKILCSDGSEAHKYAKANGFAAVQPPASERIYGSDRYATAVSVSKKSFPDGAKTVVIASGLDYADALTGVPLAKALGAPILLCAGKTIDSTTLAEIKRLGAEKAVILGGTGAVSSDVAQAVENQGAQVTRITGANRFETSSNIAAELAKISAPDSVFFVYSGGFADAISASSIAAVKGAAVIYVKTSGSLDESAAKYLASVKSGIKHAYIIGGTAVISANMKAAIESALGIRATRLFGANRYSTCTAVNTHFASLLTGDSVCVATGKDFPDALTGGVFAAMNNAPLLLADSSLSTEQTALLSKKAAAKVYALGGTGAVPDSIIRRVCESSV